MTQTAPNDWHATHTVSVSGGAEQVMRFHDDAEPEIDSLYTREEWDGCIASFWTLDSQRGLLGNGHVVDGASYAETPY